MTTYTLFSTSACHLCELAKELVRQAQAAGAPLELREVDISDTDELFERYGLRIPVLQAPDGRELGWPFDQAALLAFIG